MNPHDWQRERLELGELEPAPDTDRENERPCPGSFEISHGGTRGEDCAVDANCERGEPDDWFEVHYSATAEVLHFCARHALAAEALVTLGGWVWRGTDVPGALRALERGRPEKTTVIVRCGQATCPSLAVYSYEWPGRGELFACQPCGAKAQAVGRALGLMIILRPLPGAAVRLALTRSR